VKCATYFTGASFSVSSPPGLSRPGGASLEPARLPSRARRPGLAIAGRRKLRKRKENPADPVNPVRQKHH